MSVTQHRTGAEGTGVDINADVELLTEQIRALKELGSQGQVSEGQRYDFSIRWGTIQAGRLRRLVHYSALGMLTEADEHRFHELCAELRTLTGLIDRFRLAQPVFTEGKPAKAKRHRAPRQSSSWRGSPRRPESPSPAI
ncbi:hypothetical protein A5791_19465 [Mycobacterium sp. 852002-51163_SCH5372311]|uniref:hypothetical protein n=1 Tax=Mycobacterium sp. 852002-51163_SCH5372311 TaxID=1834097 RepID=UPI0007FB84DC|nr:hypothetical protein [Mycobacterium sp. 852002-51163_SCH5372311]OBF87260.1 hypothetical protein A5791_19465 [Mycobacterium sp. 852002-51163_SCH5372311]